MLQDCTLGFHNLGIVLQCSICKDRSHIMNDHVSLSVDNVVHSEKCPELGAGDHAEIARSSSQQDMETSPLLKGENLRGASSCREAPTVLEPISGSEVSCSSDVGVNGMTCTAAMGRAGTITEQKAHEVENDVDEEAVPLLRGVDAGVDGKEVVVAIETVPNGSKKAIDPPAVAECRICQEEDDISNLESPCACSGSLKFAHRKCIQHWCNEKGDTLCEICQKPFEGGYATSHETTTDSFPVNIGVGWDIATGQPRLFALAADHHFLEGDYDEYAGSHANSAACFRSVALILVALLLLRHIISMTGVGEDEDLSTFFMLSLVRAAGFLIPCYIMARAMNALQIRRQRQEAEVAHLIQTGRLQGVVAAEP